MATLIMIFIRICPGEMEAVTQLLSIEKQDKLVG